TDKLLGTMTTTSSEKAKKYLENMGVLVQTDTRVESYDGRSVITTTGNILSLNVIWTAGMKGISVDGIPKGVITPAGRIEVDKINRVTGMDDVYAVGDIAYMATDQFPKGHPQVAPVAIAQARNLARNLINTRQGRQLQPFRYKDKGIMATVGRNLAVVELPFIKFGGFPAWVTWMFVHLMSILGIKNKFFIFVNWLTNYFSYNLSLRLIIKPGK
ncbi:MAG TPA: FAD-dependent oxidoreductase, partial [Mariniphaga sp.]|nr:FAD-dependent oxidoreductase [Mariniphaga sp.]